MDLKGPFREALTWIERKLSYRFENPFLLRIALTHTSYVNEVDGTLESNERFEFLGDSILNAITSIILMERFPRYSEGELSRFRSRVVSEASLASLALEMGIDRFILLGKGEEKGGGRKKASILASAFEALVAAVYMDGGFERAFERIGPMIRECIERIESTGAYEDYKTLLQEVSQRLYREQPEYRVVKEEGPEHAKTFEVEVLIRGRVLGRGRGRSKKEAEKEAARKALEGMKGA